MDNDGFNSYQPPQNDPFGEPKPPRGETPYYRPRDFRAAARNALRGFWTLAVIVTLVAAILGGVSSVSAPSLDFNFGEEDISMEEIQQIPGASENPFVAVMQYVREYYDQHPALKVISGILGVLAMVQFVVGGPVMLGYTRFKLHRMDGEEAKFSDLFSAFDQFIEGLWMRVRTFLQVFAWTLLFIIPGIVAAYRYAMVPYLMAEYPDMSVSEAFQRSKTLMKGRKGDLFLLHLSFIGWWIIVGLTLGVASLWVSPYQQMAETAFYRNLSGEVVR